MVTVLLIKPECDGVLIDLADVNAETIHRLIGGVYTMTHLKASNMSVIHNSGNVTNLHLNREIGRKLYFGTVVIARCDNKGGLTSLRSDDILELVQMVPQKHQHRHVLPRAQKPDIDERIKWLKEKNGFIQYGKRKAR